MADQRPRRGSIIDIAEQRQNLASLDVSLTPARLAITHLHPSSHISITQLTYLSLLTSHLTNHKTNPH